MLGTREFTDQTKPQVMRLGLHWLWASFHKGNSRKIWTGRGQSMWHPKEKLVFPLTWPTRSQGSRRRSCSAQGLQGCSSAQVELSPLAEVCLQSTQRVSESSAPGSRADFSPLRKTPANFVSLETMSSFSGSPKSVTASLSNSLLFKWKCYICTPLRSKE